MAAVISATAPTCTPSHSRHGPSRLSRASGATPPPPALAKNDVQDTPLFTDEEFRALMSGQCELLSFSDNDHRSSSSSPPLLSLQLQAQLLCSDEDSWVQETTPPPFALDDLAAPISDGDIEQLAPLLCDEEIQALCAPPAQHSSMQFSMPRSDDQTGRKRMSSSLPWPSCISDDDGVGEVEAGPPPPPPPPPTKNARTKTTSRSRFRRQQLPPPPPVKKARTHTNRTWRPEHAAAAREDRLRHRIRNWHRKIATRILTRQFRAPVLSRGRTALTCQCPELALLANDVERRGGFGFGCCALHQDALPRDRAWMYSAKGHVPLVGGPGEVLVPKVSAGSSKAMVQRYARWRRSVSLPSRFYVEQRAVEKSLAQQPDDGYLRWPTISWAGGIL